MNFKSILTACAIFCVSSPAFAQNFGAGVNDQSAEYLARNLCTDADPANATEKCSEWVSVATCTMAYDEQQPNVEKLFSNEQMQQFRMKG